MGEGERDRKECVTEERVFYDAGEKIRKGEKKKRKEIQSAPADRSRSDVVTAEEDRTKDIPILNGSFS